MIVSNAATKAATPESGKKSPLRILYLEDDPLDVERARLKLDNEGIECEMIRVETQDEFLSALKRGGLDLILADYALPSFEGLAALSMAREIFPEIPFILMSGTPGEELAIDSIKAGATDYVLKQRLFRLVPAVTRALREVEAQTQRRRAEEALRESEKLYKLHFENVGDVIYSLDNDLRVTTISPSIERIMGYTAQEIIGRRIDELDIIPPKDREQTLSNARRVLMGERGSPSVYEFIAKDGTRRLAEVSATPKFKEGKIIGSVDVAKDGAERQKLQEHLRRAQRMEAVGQLAGGVAHDFNNLLTAILGYTNRAMQQVCEDSPIHTDLREVEKAGMAAADLTRQLLAFSRNQTIKPRVVNLNYVLTGMKNMLNRLIREDIELALKAPHEELRIMADPGQIEQIIVNLVTNASDASPEGGKIELETSIVESAEAWANKHAFLDADRYACLKITDTGCGMSDEDKSRIFDPFFTTKPEGKGTGLGLSTVYGIVERHRGLIEVESQKGRGTTFRVYLPMVDAPCDAPASARGDERLPSGSATILVVEDEEMVRNVTVKSLSTLGYTVLEASGGQEALALIDEKRIAPDLLVTDLIMPGMSGRKLAEEFMRRFPSAGILFISGYIDDALQEESALNPRVELLEKPFVPEELARMAQTLLGRAETARPDDREEQPHEVL